MGEEFHWCTVQKIRRKIFLKTPIVWAFLQMITSGVEVEVKSVVKSLWVLQGFFFSQPTRESLVAEECRCLVQVKNEIGQTPLHEAANQGHAKIVEQLLKEGADPRARDNVRARPVTLCFDWHTTVCQACLSRVFTQAYEPCVLYGSQLCCRWHHIASNVLPM